jgi:hypothetical protein
VHETNFHSRAIFQKHFLEPLLGCLWRKKVDLLLLCCLKAVAVVLMRSGLYSGKNLGSTKNTCFKSSPNFHVNTHTHTHTHTTPQSVFNRSESSFYTEADAFVNGNVFHILIFFLAQFLIN